MGEREGELDGEGFAFDGTIVLDFAIGFLA